MTSLRILLTAALATAAAYPETLTNFQPSARKSAFGPVSQVQFATGLMEVEPGSLAMHLPGAMLHFQFNEPVWIIGYRTFIEDAQGKPPRDNHLCHTFLGDQRVMQSEDQEVRGLYSDAFTPDVELPDGFGIRVPAEETLHWMPMFNNRAETTARVRMKVELTVIREKEMKKRPTALYGALHSVATPHLYFVQPGQSTKEATFEIPFEGRIHFMGTHIHPHGEWVELENVTRKQKVWRGQHTSPALMDTFASAEGYPVHAGETFRVRALYDNKTGAPVDAMAGLYIMYSRK